MTDIGNKLIHRLPLNTRECFLKHCEPFELGMSIELSPAHANASHAYFPEQGCLSLIVEIEDRRSLGISMIGNEAMVGSERVLGMSAPPWRVLVQQPGASWRISHPDLQRQCREIPQLKQLMQSFLLVRLHQQALASICQHYHPVASRLARWLLMNSDRCTAKTGSFHVTQELMALMLGVRRVSITNVASGFQNDGMIAYKRGEMNVLNRAALERRACSCYATDKKIYSTIMDAGA